MPKNFPTPRTCLSNATFLRSVCFRDLMRIELRFSVYHVKSTKIYRVVCDNKLFSLVGHSLNVLNVGDCS